MVSFFTHSFQKSIKKNQNSFAVFIILTARACDLVILQCTYSQGQIAQLNSAVKGYEELIRDYKVQVG